MGNLCCLVLIDSWGRLEEQGVGETLPGQNLGLGQGEGWVIFKNQGGKEREKDKEKERRDCHSPHLPSLFFNYTHGKHLYFLA